MECLPKDTNEYIGWYILKHLLDTGEVEVGFRIKKKFWGKGYSTEAGNALVKHGFETVGLKRIIAIVRPDNFASLAVIKKIGLKEEGTGTFHDTFCLYFGLDRKTYGLRKEIDKGWDGPTSKRNVQDIIENRMK